VATVIALAGCGDSRRGVSPQGASAALYYAHYYAQHQSDRRVRMCLGLPVASGKRTVAVRCL